MTSSEEETKWTDACIRWEDEEPPSKSEDEEEERPWDPFADPDPTQSFDFEFQYKDSSIVISLEGYKADSDESWQSTGLTLWKASHILNDYLLKHASAWKGKNLLELGAGLGVCSILVQRILVTSTSDSDIQSTLCVTDGDTEALPVLRDNVQVNCPSQEQHSISCHQLLWGRETSDLFGQKHGSFDVIYASDIVYAPSILKPLWETIDVLLKSDGMFVLAFCRRKVPVQVENVLQAAKESGFTHDCVMKKEKDGVYLYVFRRESSV